MTLTAKSKVSIGVLVGVLSLFVTVLLWANSQHDYLNDDSIKRDVAIEQKMDQTENSLSDIKANQFSLQTLTELQEKKLDRVEDKLDVIDSKINELLLHSL